MFLKRHRLLFDTPTPAADGAAPALSMLTGGQPAPTPEQATPPPPTPPANESWLSALPKDMQDNVSLKKFTSVEALAGSYLNASKMIGADKIAVPTKHTTPEEFRALLHKIGLPEKVEDYSGGIKFKDSVKEDSFKKAFVAHAYKNGVLPSAAQAMADFYADQAAVALDKVAASRNQQFDQDVAALKQEWGGAFGANVAKANKVLADVGGEAFANHFNDAGYGGDKEMVKFLAKVGGEMFKEHKFVDGNGTAGGLTPQELNAKIAAAQAHPAYFDKLHPQHKAIVDEVQSLYQKKFPVDKG